jgi:hypothetical protein
VEALAPGYPGVEAVEGAIQGQNFAHAAAGVSVGLPQVRVGIGGGEVLEDRAQVAHVPKTQPRSQHTAIVQGLAEEHACIEEENRNARVYLRREVQEHGRLGAKGRHQRQAWPEGVQSRGEHISWMSLPQLTIQSPSDVALGGIGGFGTIKRHQDLPRSAKAGSRPSAAR